MNEIEDFISRRFKGLDARWLDGNCYWFAQILLSRFPYLDLYYLPIEGHFIVGKDKHFYDFRGEVLPQETPLQWSLLSREEPKWCRRILRDCRD